jgi:hypothetical protein
VWLVHPRFAPALWLDRFGAYLQWFASRPSIRIIHIVRRDPLEWLKSKYLADKSRAFAGREYPDGIKVHIPIGEGLRRLKTKGWIDRRLSQLSATNPYVRIVYEDFLESDRAIVSQLMEFLGCNPERLSDFEYRKQQKQSKRPAHEYITNYRQVVAALQETGQSAG